jgi:hypothetical protein
MEPVGGLDVKRDPVGFNAEAPHFTRKMLPRFAERPVKKVHGVPLQKQRLVAVHRRSDLIPGIGFKYTRHSHI